MALTKPQARQDKSIVLQNSIDITPDDIQDNQISIDQKNARINFISISDNKRKVSTVFETEEGAVAAGAISQFVGAFNSSIDQLTEAVITNGIWSYTDKLVYNNTQYNTSTGLVTLSNSNKWTVVWFYRSIGDAKQTFYVLGDSEYNNEAAADKAVERTDLPLLLRKHCIPIGRILIRYGMDSGTVESAFRPTYQSTNVINHNDTANKQGGTTNEYYHLTSLDYTDKILNRRFGTVSGGNYTEFESDGTVKLVGDASVYDDIFVGLTSAKLPQANVPTWTTFTTNTNAYTFAINDYIDLPTIEINHDYKEGTDLEVHLHIATNGVDTTNRYVKFIVYYTYAIPFSASTQFVTEQNISNELLIPANTLDKTSMYLQLGTIAGTTLKMGTQLKIRLKRITSVGTAPTSNPFVGMIGVHYQKDTMGSRQINSK